MKFTCGDIYFVRFDHHVYDFYDDVNCSNVKLFDLRKGTTALVLSSQGDDLISDVTILYDGRCRRIRWSDSKSQIFTT